jgi:hypothetical protein
MRILSLAIGSLIVIFAISAPARSQMAGVVVEASQPAELQRSATRSAIAAQTQIQLGDVISTGRNGRVQIVFADETRIAVGENSRLVIDDILFNTQNTASRFAVSAVTGAFRFLSGNSSPDAYSINTPLATLGIRGTVFDFSVTQQRGVDLATFEGEVSMCFRNGGCARVAGSCTLLTAPIHAERFEQPETLQEKRELLESNFPFVINQSRLRRDFRAPVRSCGYQRLIEQTGIRPQQPSSGSPRQDIASAPGERSQPESSVTVTSSSGQATATATRSDSGSTATATTSGATATATSNESGRTATATTVRD